MLHTIGYAQAGETYTWFPARLENGVLNIPEHGVELTASARGA
jgi:CRISPR-associated protein Cas5d